MSDTQTCKREVELTVGILELAAETDRVAAQYQQQARLPGFRPGKAPASMVKAKFATDIKQQVVENLVPKVFREYAEKEKLNVVGQPSVTDIHYHEGEPMKLKAEFEVAPEFELNVYKGIEVPYDQPVVAETDVEARLNAIRDQKADYVNIDPRPADGGDFAVVTLKSVAGVDGPPISQDELMLEVGGDETLPQIRTFIGAAAPASLFSGHCAGVRNQRHCERGTGTPRSDPPAGMGSCRDVPR